MTDAAQGAGGRRAAPWLALTGGVLAVVFVVRLHELLLVAFIAVLLAVYLAGFTRLLCRRLRLPHAAGLVLSLVLTLAALVGIGFLLAPAVATQAQDLVDAVPRYLGALDDWVRDATAGSELMRRTGIASGDTGLVTTTLTEAFSFLRRSFLSYAASTGKLLIEGAAVIAMALYLAARPAAYVGGIVAAVPPRHRERARAIAVDMGDTFRSWVGAQLLAMVVLALATGLGLWILDVPFWLAFAIFAGVAVMVPFFGSITSTLLPALLVLPDRGIVTALLVAGVGVVVHVIEANLVHPLIMQHRIALPPALTILSVLVMGSLAGLVGMLVAVPALASAVVLVRHVLIHYHYGEEPGDWPAHAVLQPSRRSGTFPAPAASPTS